MVANGLLLSTIYTALIRSLLEHCCVVWHHALPSYLSQELERIQKRTLKIIVPALSYSDALQALNLRTLDERRNELCVKTGLKRFQEEVLLSNISQ